MPSTCGPTWWRSITRANPRSYLASDSEPARFYVDSLVHDPDALRMLLKLFGASRVALGSDYPFPLGEEHPGKLIESLADLAESEKSQLLAGTAREFRRDALSSAKSYGMWRRYSRSHAAGMLSRGEYGPG